MIRALLGDAGILSIPLILAAFYRWLGPTVFRYLDYDAHAKTLGFSCALCAGAIVNTAFCWTADGLAKHVHCAHPLHGSRPKLLQGEIHIHEG